MPSGRKRKKTVAEMQILLDRTMYKLKRCRAQLKAEKAKWDERCPQGHLYRHDQCTLSCEIVVIDPVDTLLRTLLPKVPEGHLVHEWRMDDTNVPPVPYIPLSEDPLTVWGKMVKGLYEQFDVNLVEQQTGWWWRKPYQWWLNFVAWYMRKDEETNV